MFGWVLDAWVASGFATSWSLDARFPDNSAVGVGLSLALLGVLEDETGVDCGADAGVSVDSDFAGFVPASAEAYSRLNRCGSWKSS